MDDKKKEKKITELQIDLWRLNRVKQRNINLEEEIVAYWKNISNGNLNPPKAPDLIRLLSFDNNVIHYELLSKKGDKYVCYGFGNLGMKSLEKFRTEIDAKIKKIIDELNKYGVDTNILR